MTDEIKVPRRCRVCHRPFVQRAFRDAKDGKSWTPYRQLVCLRCANGEPQIAKNCRALARAVVLNLAKSISSKRTRWTKNRYLELRREIDLMERSESLSWIAEGAATTPETLIADLRKTLAATVEGWFTARMKRKPRQEAKVD